MENNKLDIKISISNLFKFTVPTIIMMIFTSIYTLIDGVFVSNFVGTNALSAVNIVYPLFNLILAIGIMLATGGSALSGYFLGQGDNKKANSVFTLVTVVGIVVGLIIGLFGIFFTKEIVTILGANDVLMEYCKDYAFYLSLGVPFGILQLLYQYYLVTAGKPMLGLILTILGGITNIILDYVFIVPLNMGIKGAAIATIIGMMVPSILGFLFFTLKRKNILHYIKCKFNFKDLLKVCSNGSSEMVSNLSVAITTFLFNNIMIKLAGEDGVAAITILLYAQFVLSALYLGYSSGVAPLISFNYGNNNEKRLKKLFKYSNLFIIISSVAVFILSILSADILISIFAPRGSNVYNIAYNGYMVFSISFLFMGINLFASSMFTAFNNGKISAVISFLRSFVFIIGMLITLPFIFGTTGVFLAIPLAELLCLFISVLFFVKCKNYYKY